MARSLVIVESPAKARTLARFLGRGYVIKASMGHVRDLPKSKFGVDVDNGFEPNYVTIKKQQKVVSELKSAAKSASRVLLATDPDREGEAISWHLAHLLGVDERDNCRVVFHEITPQAVTNAIKEPRMIDENLVNAQQARRLLDRIVGYRLSPLLWKKVRYGLSAGRVQSVAVRLICDREAEIKAFVPEEYWSLEARLQTADNEEFTASYYGRDGKKSALGVEQDARLVIDEVRESPFAVASVTRKPRKKNPPPPFITSTLQQEAARKLGFTARRTMAVAQQLYEGLEVGSEGSVGLITYMRTDSRRLSDQGVAQAAAFIKKRFGAAYSQPRKYQAEAKKKNVQDAHEAIRPTGVEREPDQLKPYLNSEQLRLYRLIWSRFVASQMKPAIYDTVSADIDSGRHRFRATGSRIEFPGYLTVYIEGRDSESEDDTDRFLPPLKEGQSLRLAGLDPARHFTQPPPQYTEALLVKTLEELGIGRPSTYAPILDTIVYRNYVVREDKKFVPTTLGCLVVDLLKTHFKDIIDAEFTAALEKDLDRIEEGTADWKRLVAEFYAPFDQAVARAEENLERVRIPDEETDEVCELCGKKMVIKYGRFGRFLACPGYPDCKHTRALVTRTGVNCPHCGKEIVGRKSKKGRLFYGCSGYPECKFVSWQKPLAENCPECGAFLVERRQRGKGATLSCSRAGCEYERVKATRTKKAADKSE